MASVASTTATRHGFIMVYSIRLVIWRVAQTLSDHFRPVNCPGPAGLTARQLLPFAHGEGLGIALVVGVLDFRTQFSWLMRHECEAKARILADGEIHLSGHDGLAGIAHRHVAHKARRFARIEITGERRLIRMTNHELHQRRLVVLE